MSNDLSPVLRLIPYLLAFSAAIFAGIPVVATSHLALAVAVIAVTYFATYFLSRFVIGGLAARSGQDTVGTTSLGNDSARSDDTHNADGDTTRPTDRDDS